MVIKNVSLETVCGITSEFPEMISRDCLCWYI